MGFTNLWPLFLTLTIPLLVMLYILKRKYKEQIISSSLLWKEVYKNTRANTPWEKLRKNIMLLLQLIILISLILALMKPFVSLGGKSYKNIILVIDNTASMRAQYENKTRLEEAKSMAKKLILGTKEGTNTFIVSFDGNSNLIQSGDFDKAKSVKAILDIKPTYGTGDISNTISFIKAIGSGIGEEYEVVFITDKDLDLEDIKGKVISLASSGINASIDNISHKFVEKGAKVIATVTNRGTGNYQGDFSLYDGEKLVEVETLSLNKGESKTIAFNLDSINSEYLKGELSRKDMILEDNTYNHIIGKKKNNKILVVTEKNVFLEKAFSVLENTEVFKTNSIENITDKESYDLYVFDNVTPNSIPKNGSVLFINPNSNELFAVYKGGEMGEAVTINGEVSRYLEGTKFTLSKYSSIETPYYGRDFLKVEDKTIGFKGEIDRRKVAALSFDLHNSDFALKKEFPILMYELGEYLISTGVTSSSNFKGGDKITIKASGKTDEVTLTSPKGEVTKVLYGGDIISTNNLGIYKISSEDGEEKFSINFPTEKESDISLANVSENENITKVNGTLRRAFNINPVLILLAIAVVAIEWIMYKKGN